MTRARAVRQAPVHPQPRQSARPRTAAEPSPSWGSRGCGPTDPSPRRRPADRRALRRPAARPPPGPVRGWSSAYARSPGGARSATANAAVGASKVTTCGRDTRSRGSLTGCSSAVSSMSVAIGLAPRRPDPPPGRRAAATASTVTGCGQPDQLGDRRISRRRPVRPSARSRARWCPVRRAGPWAASPARSGWPRGSATATGGVEATSADDDGWRAWAPARWIRWRRRSRPAGGRTVTAVSPGPYR